jgi:hypothetical protein
MSDRNYLPKFLWNVKDFLIFWGNSEGRNDPFQKETSQKMTPLYTMPVPPQASHPDHDYYQAFVHVMNRLPHTMAIGIKLRTAIENTAEFMRTSPAHVARLLVDYGLRAPRQAFPASFLDYVDATRTPRHAVQRAAMDSDVIELKDFWQTLVPYQERVLESA